MRLSILICTTRSRKKVFDRIYGILKRQAKHFNNVEILVNEHETDTVGKKRNDLLTQAKGDYVVFVDSDDLVYIHYVKLILKAIQTNPDCIGISGIMTTNGKNPVQWHISKDFKSWHKKGRVYYRTPNHISPVKREIALKVGFPDVSNGEDYAYSMGILPYLNTEVKIKTNLYTYLYDSKK